MTPSDSTPIANLGQSPDYRPRKVGKLVLGAILLMGAGYAVTRTVFQGGPVVAPVEEPQTEGPFPPDPRLQYQGPFRNVRPGVQYVGDAACAKCHPKVAQTYAKHPMGRSIIPTREFMHPLPLDVAHHNPFEAFGIQYRVDRQGDRLFHRQTRFGPDGRAVYEFAHEVDYVVGSGARGHSYLSVRDGFVFQTPVSWFTQKQIWGLSPGFPPWARVGRLIQGACLYCHANQTQPVEGTRNRYHEPIFQGHAIGCERCHGPGELHARSSDRDDVVDPIRLPWELREAVCQQCHLEGATRVLRRGRAVDDFRPGMPLQEFWTVFVPGPGSGEGHKAVSHVEQMYESVCFQESPAGRKMGCTSCHNPHEAVAPENRARHYRDRCLQCHVRPATECRVPDFTRRLTSPEDSCFACHMPRTATTDVVHVASTDHRIVRQPTGNALRRRDNRPPSDLRFLDFFRGPPDLQDRGLARDLGVAMHQLTLKGIPLSERDGTFALRLLDGALTECPGDVDGWEAKGKILQTIRRPEQAITAFETLLRRSPRHETALVSLGTIHRDLGQPDRAVDYWRRAVEVNPWVPEYRKNLATHLAEQNAWEELRPHCRRWLEQDPASVEARCLWVQCLLQAGQKAEAAGEYAKVQALRPPDLARLDAWFLPQLR